MKECKTPGMTRIVCLLDKGTDVNSCEWMKKLRTEPPPALILSENTVQRAVGCPFQSQCLDYISRKTK